MDFSKTIYFYTRSFPDEEKFGLVSQMRRAVTSIPINIAEGCGHESDRELKRFIQIAAGSASELECEIILSEQLGYINEEIFNSLITEIGEIKMMIRSFLTTLTANC